MAKWCVRGEWGPPVAPSGVGQKPSGGPSQGWAAVTQPPPHRTHPSLGFLRRAQVEKTGRKRTCRLGRHWGDDPGEAAGLGGAARDGVGAPERLARPFPPLGAISIRNRGPGPRTSGSGGSECSGRRARPTLAGGGLPAERREGPPDPLPRSRRPSWPRLARPGWGRCRWRELRGKLSGSRGGRGAGRRAAAGGRGRADVTLLCFHWSLLVGAGG